MGRKKTYEEISAVFELNNATLLTTKENYKNTQQALSYRCSCGRISTTRYYNFKKYKHCNECGIESRGRKMRKYTYNDMYEYFKKYDCILLTEFHEDIISTSNIKFKCSCGNEEETQFKQFVIRKTKKCLECSGHIKTPYNKVIDIFNKANCTLLTTIEEYMSNPSRGYNLKYICSCGNTSVISLQNFKNGSRCKQCMGKRISNTNKIPFDEVKKYIESFNGYKLLSKEYVNCDTHLEIQCPDGHIFYMDFYHFKNRGQRCSVCNALRDKSGENSNTWQGGLTPLNHMLRSNLKEWKFKSLENHNFQCIITGSKKSLHVHHIIPFNIIIEEILNELDIPKEKLVQDYTDEEINNIKSMIDDYHFKNLGVPITKKYHRLFHSIYGHNANEEDLMTFISDYKKR